MDRMGDGPILSDIHIATIDTIPDNNGANNRCGLKNVTCKQGLKDIKNGNNVQAHMIIFVPYLRTLYYHYIQHDSRYYTTC